MNFTFKKILFSLLLLLIISLNVFCQPSEADIKKQLTNSNTIAIKFTKPTGTRQWNSSLGNWEYVRGVVMKQKSFEYPELKVEIGGDAVYQDMGGGKYSYKKFRFLYQSFEGIPNPRAEDIEIELVKNWPAFYGAGFKKITKLIQQPSLAAEPEWLWHTPLSVSFKMEYEADFISGYTIIETRKVNCTVRLYRSGIKDNWNTFIVNDANPIVVKKVDVTNEEMEELKSKTLAYTFNELQSEEEVSNLPKVNVPVFDNMYDLAYYLHQQLMDGDSSKMKAVLLQTLDKNIYFIGGSNVQLNERGKILVNNVLTQAFKGNFKYKDQYCIKPKLAKLTSTKHIYFEGIVPKTTTQISGTLASDGYINGQQVKKWKIIQFDIGVRQDKDAQQFVQSLSNKALLCN